MPVFRSWKPPAKVTTQQNSSNLRAVLQRTCSRITGLVNSGVPQRPSDYGLAVLGPSETTYTCYRRPGMERDHIERGIGHGVA
jgi:hypothetical protein